MRILYGVQGTGNGHLTRARAMQKALQNAGIEVDWVFSGREKTQYFDMDMFGDFRCFKGLSFASRQGKIDAFKTVTEASFSALLKDVNTLDISGYNLVLTDFEPVVAWAAKLKKVPCIGIGHQYAFSHDIPKVKNAFASYAIMKWFAPVSFGIGVHWHHFNQPILPPIIEQLQAPAKAPKNKALVYLPFEDSREMLATLNSSPYEFIFHSKELAPGQYGNVLVKGYSVLGFQESLHECGAVICNAGFELASECLNLGRKILVKPLAGQVEQASNAKALLDIECGYVSKDIDEKAISQFMTTAKSAQIRYPDVPKQIAHWLKQYPKISYQHLVDSTWSEVDFCHQTRQPEEASNAQVA